MIDGKNFFDQPIKDNKITYENIRKIATGQGDDYTTGCLLNYAYLKNYYKMIVIDLDADPSTIQQINFTTNLVEQETQESISFLKKQRKLS